MHKAWSTNKSILRMSVLMALFFTSAQVVVADSSDNNNGNPKLVQVPLYKQWGAKLGQKMVDAGEKVSSMLVVQAPKVQESAQPVSTLALVEQAAQATVIDNSATPKSDIVVPTVSTNAPVAQQGESENKFVDIIAANVLDSLPTRSELSADELQVPSDMPEALSSAKAIDEIDEYYEMHYEGSEGNSIVFDLSDTDVPTTNVVSGLVSGIEKSADVAPILPVVNEAQVLAQVEQPSRPVQDAALQTINAAVPIVPSSVNPQDCLVDSKDLETLNTIGTVSSEVGKVEAVDSGAVAGEKKLVVSPTLPSDAVAVDADNSTMSWLYISGGVVAASLVAYKLYNYLQNRMMTPQKLVASIIAETDVSVVQQLCKRIVEVAEVNVKAQQKPVLTSQQVYKVMPLIEELNSAKRRQIMIAVMLYKFEIGLADKKQLIKLLQETL